MLTSFSHFISHTKPLSWSEIRLPSCIWLGTRDTSPELHIQPIWGQGEEREVCSRSLSAKTDDKRMANMLAVMEKFHNFSELTHTSSATTPITEKPGGMENSATWNTQFSRNCWPGTWSVDLLHPSSPPHQLQKYCRPTPYSFVTGTEKCMNPAWAHLQGSYLPVLTFALPCTDLHPS